MNNLKTRKVVCYIITICSIFILLTGCASETKVTESPDVSEKPVITIEAPEYPIKIYRERMGGVSNWDETQIKEWQEYMLDKYGYTVELLLSEKNYIMTVDLEEIKEKTGLDSLVYCDSLT
ncbi:MAG: hypothetical protein KAH14_10250, partial [Clostridiales bacterium]|nr:hypothetical protein [Clostridiales bacterium]